MNTLGIYIHIPFCHSKCLYCDFISYALTPLNKNTLVNAYFNALKKEIYNQSHTLSNYLIKSIYIGGGTPSAVDSSYIIDVINLIKKIGDVDDNAEITIEVNPGTLTEKKVMAYKSCGINRVSMGLQTTNNKLLKEIGRIHTYEDFFTSYEYLIKNGLDNISTDLIFGLPGQSNQDLIQSIDLIDDLLLTHISAYSLKVEENTPFYNMQKKGKLQLPSDDEEREMYYTLRKILKTKGFEQYELSNFSKVGWESRHNLIYWENQPYLGFGVAAHSKIEMKRFSNSEDINVYIKANENNLEIHENIVDISKEEDLFETIILGLRLNKGIDIKAIERNYQIDFFKKYHLAINRLLDLNLIVLESKNKIIKLTEGGMDFSNRVFLEFMTN